MIRDFYFRLQENPKLKITEITKIHIITKIKVWPKSSFCRCFSLANLRRRIFPEHLYPTWLCFGRATTLISTVPDFSDGRIINVKYVALGSCWVPPWAVKRITPLFGVLWLTLSRGVWCIWDILHVQGVLDPKLLPEPDSRRASDIRYYEEYTDESATMTSSEFLTGLPACPAFFPSRGITCCIYWRIYCETPTLLTVCAILRDTGVKGEIQLWTGNKASKVLFERETK